MYARLACYERSNIYPNSRASACLTRPSEQQRLACFEQGEERSGVAPAAVPVEARPAQFAPPSMLPAAEQAPRWRIEAGLSYGQGRYDGTITTGTAEVKTQSLLGGAGHVGHVGLWRDGIWGGRWSAGLEYVRLHTEAGIQVDFPDGLGGGFFPAFGIDGVVTAEADLAVFNILYRPRNRDSMRPYVGGGIAVGRAGFQTEFATTGLISIDEEKESSLVAGLQAMAGVELDLTNRLYLSPQVRMLYFTGEPVGLHHSYLDLSAGAGLGYRF